ncbi:CinA family protein [Luteococcus sp.]|uniref:CinA family protein n=1 Tax=Luteococcus sp. TaxID=1969402 RepID=UPI0037355FDC
MSHAVWPDLVPVAGRVVEQLAARGLTLGTCESLTGGALAATLTEVPGASRVVRGGLVTYASELKVALAGVDAEGVVAHGVVNEDTAVQMARGARRALGVDLAVSCTGVAGPSPQDGQAVGAVWIALAGVGDAMTTRFHHFDGGRSAIRWNTGRAALELLAAHLGDARSTQDPA